MAITLNLAENVKQVIERLLPSSAIQKISCFCLYDHHPMDQKKIDIVFCNITGKIIECYKRDVLCSFDLHCDSAPSQIQILRNRNSELLYLVIAGDSLFILSRKSHISFHKTFNNIGGFDLCDPTCSGQTVLKISFKDKQKNVTLDDNFEVLNDEEIFLEDVQMTENTNLKTHLMRKYIAAEYNVKHNEKVLNDLMKIRQMSALQVYQKNCPNSEEALFKSNEVVDYNSSLKIKTSTPWVQLCNDHVILVITLYQHLDEPLEGICIVLHQSKKLAFVYTTKLFERISEPPFWRERTEKTIDNFKELCIAAVIRCGEIESIVSERLEFSGAISYTKAGREYLIPFEDVCISAEAFRRSKYRTLDKKTLDEKTCLAVVSTSYRTEMTFRHIRRDTDPSINIPVVCSVGLKMEYLNESKNVLINKEPRHELYGMMLIFEQRQENKDVYDVIVYAANSTQIKNFIAGLPEYIPHSVLLTKKCQKVTAINESYSRYDDDFIVELSSIDYEDYALSLIEQGDIIKEYFDNCISHMKDSKDPEIKAKVGKEIDIFGPGLEEFKEFRKKIYEVGGKGAHLFNTKNTFKE